MSDGIFKLPIAVKYRYTICGLTKTTRMDGELGSMI